MTDTHTYAHPCLPLILHVYKHTSWGASFIALPGAHPFYTHTETHRHTHGYRDIHTDTHAPAHPHTLTSKLDCLHKHIFLLHVYRSVSLVRIWRYTQLAYLFHQCVTSLLIRDGRIADCTVRHPGVKR